MTHGLKPYPAYKDSGVPSLGNVPEHWDIKRQRNLVEMGVSSVDKHTNDGELPVRLCNYIDVYKNDRITDRISFMRATAMPDEIARFRLELDDVLITKDSEAWDDIGVPALVEFTATDLVCGYHLALLRPRKKIMTGGYLFRALQSPGVAYQYHVSANGVTRFGLSHDAIKSIVLPVPSFAEQSAIVRFLDYADRRIRHYINAKRKLIALLSEQKQAIIHRAVTRGLDPNVRLKPSGVERLGDVPEHWEVIRFKRRVGFQEGPGIMAADFRDQGVPLLRISCLRGDVATLDGCNYLDPDMVQRRWSHFRIRAGDYLLSASASTGAVVLATEAVSGSIPYTGILRLWPTSNQTFMPFLRLFMGCQAFQDQIDVAKSGVAIEHFGPTHLKRMFISLPPLKEQQAIVQWINSQAAPSLSTISRAQREIDLMREYRTRLIADVVTGRVDVREAAAKLPEKSEEPEPFEEVEEVMEGTEIAEEAGLEPEAEPAAA
jgi:type I restriction enzyme S subunit